MMGFMPRWVKRIFIQTLELKPDDIVVFVVGPTGGGKSGFIKEATRSDLIIVGKRLEPCTTEVRAIRSELTAEARTALQVSEKHKYIVFVDTPSFLTGTDNEKEAEENTGLWLRKSKSKSTLVGTIYVDRVANISSKPTPSSPPNTIQKHLDIFARTFPTTQDFESPPPLRLHCVLTYDSKESKIAEGEIKSRKGVFQEELRTVDPSTFWRHGKSRWNTSFHPECLQRETPEIAWSAVVALFS